MVTHPMLHRLCNMHSLGYFDLALDTRIKDQIQRLLTYFDQQGKESILLILQDRLDILCAQELIKKRKSENMDRKTVSDAMARKVEPIRPTVTNLDDYFDAQQVEINAEVALSEILAILSELDDYLDAELKSKKPRLEDSSSMEDNDALDDHFERANMARFMIARQTIQRATVPDEYLAEKPTFVAESSYNSIERVPKYDDINEVYVASNSPQPEKVVPDSPNEVSDDDVFDVSKDEPAENLRKPSNWQPRPVFARSLDGVSSIDQTSAYLETVGSSKSSVQNSNFYGIPPVNKLRPVSSSSESDDLAVEQSSVDTEDFFGGDIKIDHFEKEPKRYFLFINNVAAKLV